MTGDGRAGLTAPLPEAPRAENPLGLNECGTDGP
jgi:hypothetical protein